MARGTTAAKLEQEPLSLVPTLEELDDAFTAFQEADNKLQSLVSAKKIATEVREERLTAWMTVSKRLNRARRDGLVASAVADAVAHERHEEPSMALVPADHDFDDVIEG